MFEKTQSKPELSLLEITKHELYKSPTEIVCMSVFAYVTNINTLNPHTVSS